MIKNTETNVQQFGQRLKSFREKKGWSMGELANKADISKPYLKRLEEGGSNPSYIYASRIASALGVRVTELFGDNEDKHSYERQLDANICSQQTDNNLGLFWSLLCQRAAAVQKVYRFERYFSFDNVYQKIVDQFDRFIQKHDIYDDCASLAKEAVKLERSVWDNENVSDTSINEDLIQIWQDAVNRAEETKRKDASLALYWNLGNALNSPNIYKYQEAMRNLEKALTYLEGDEIEAEDEAGLINTLGWVSYYSAEYEKAKIFFLQAIDKWEIIDYSLTRFNGLASAYRGYGSTLQRVMLFQEAEEAFIKAIEFANSAKNSRDGNSLQLIWGEFRIGSFYKFIGNLNSAEIHFINSEQLWKSYVEPERADRGLKALRTMILNNQADLLIRRGADHNQIQKLLDDSIKIGIDIGDKRSQAYSFWFLSQLHTNSNEWDQGLLYLDKSIVLFQEMTLKRYEYTILITRVRVYCAFNAIVAALELINSVHEKDIEDRSIQILVKVTRAFVYGKNEKNELAIELFNENIPLLDGLKYEQVRARLDFAELLIKLNIVDLAYRELELARNTCEVLGYSDLLKLVKKFS